MTDKTTRREILGNLLLGGVAVTAAGVCKSSIEEKVLAEEVEGVDALSSPTRKDTNWSKLSDLKEKIPMAKLGDVKLSRMFLGGNLVSGYAHARDLIYVSDLVKAYHTKEKIFATLKLGEACGMNTFLMNPSLCDVIKEYWEKAGGAIQFITNCSGKTDEALIANMQKSIDYGASACLVQGEVADRLVREQKFDLLAQSVELVRKNDLPAGIAAHRLETLQACVAKGIRPDFWMKTFHHLKYWSAKPGQAEHDNVFCRDPQETIDFMADQPEPWIGFKVLAAGAIKPQDGFRFAFEGGADFICVGMYDFQVVDDVNICNAVLQGTLNRKRSWKSGNV